MQSDPPPVDHPCMHDGSCRTCASVPCMWRKIKSYAVFIFHHTAFAHARDTFYCTQNCTWALACLWRNTARMEHKCWCTMCRGRLFRAVFIFHHAVLTHAVHQEDDTASSGVPGCRLASDTWFACSVHVGAPRVEEDCFMYFLLSS